MSRAILIYTLFFITHNNFGIDERQFGILRAIKQIEEAKVIKT